MTSALPGSLYLVALVVAAAAFMIYRQFAARRVDESRRSLLVALALVVWGLSSVAHSTVAGIAGDTLVAAGVVAGAVLGALRGSAVRTWLGDDGRAWQGGTPMLALLWAVSVAVRAGLGVVASHAGISPHASFAELPLFVGVTLAAQNAFVLVRARAASAALARHGAV